MSSAAEYWAERNRMVMTQGLEKADAVARELEKSYRRAQREVQAAVDKIYATFAGESGLSYADAQAYLTKGELKEWRYTLEEYVERINASGDKDLLRELNALSARSRIRRLQQVQTAIDVAASELASRGEALTRDLLEDAYGGAYVQVGGVLQAGLGVGGRLEMLNRTEVAQAAAYPWSGASFSERIWNNADNLARALRQAVTQGLIQGQDVRQMSAAIAKATGSSAADAERLIRTETARCIEEATLKGYAAAGVGRYQILVDEDERTCKFCGAIDEEAVHEVAGAVTGVNLPPFHPRCRCTTVPYFSEEELDRWEALGAAASGEPAKQENPAPQAKTIQEAEEFARTQLGIPDVSYKGCDATTANAWNAGLADNLQRFPKLVENFGFVGEAHERNRRIKPVVERFYQAQAEKLRALHRFSESAIEAWRKKQVNAYMRSISVGRSTYAQSFAPESPALRPFRGVTVNRDFGKDAQAFVQAIAQDVKNRFHPVGCDTIRSILDHEIGHQLDDLLGISSRPEIQALYDARTEEELTRDLSTYAWKNDSRERYGEMIAEAWAEYCNNPHPRELARRIGETIEAEYRRKYGGTTK